MKIGGNDDNDANSNNIIFTIKSKKWYVPVVTLDNQNKRQSKLLIKEFERLVY